jgi:hypothetical protein
MPKERAEGGREEKLREALGDWAAASICVMDFKNIAARRIAMAARRQVTAIVCIVTQTIAAAATDIALCANS